MIILKKLLGKNEKSGKLELFASTQAEVPSLGEQDHWVWEGEYDTFQVYHSGRSASEAVETIQITPYIEANGYDLTTHRTKGTYYGGYALASGVTTSEDAYNGSNWTWSTMETADGTHLVPTANAVYYVKDIPTLFLHNKPIMAWSGNRVSNFLPVSDLDDLKYANAGWIVNGTTDYNLKGAATTLTVNGHLYTVADLFGAIGVTEGRLFWGNFSDFAPFIVANAETTLRAFVLTEDGIKSVSRVEATLKWKDLNPQHVDMSETIDPETGV